MTRIDSLTPSPGCNFHVCLLQIPEPSHPFNLELLSVRGVLGRQDAVQGEWLVTKVIHYGVPPCFGVRNGKEAAHEGQSGVCDVLHHFTMVPLLRFSEKGAILMLGTIVVSAVGLECGTLEVT